MVLSQADIKRSGSTNLEQFLRDYLNANASEVTSEQAFGGGGRTNVSVTASYRTSEPLLRRDRSDLTVGAQRFAFQNNPAFFAQPPTGSTPNIRSTNGQPLRLDPAFGGTLLGANDTFVPVGFRGVAIDGIAPLIANVGQYNFDLSDAPVRAAAEVR